MLQAQASWCNQSLAGTHYPNYNSTQSWFDPILCLLSWQDQFFHHHLSSSTIFPVWCFLPILVFLVNRPKYTLPLPPQYNCRTEHWGINLRYLQQRLLPWLACLLFPAWPVLVAYSGQTTGLRVHLQERRSDYSSSLHNLIAFHSFWGKLSSKLLLTFTEEVQWCCNANCQPLNHVRWWFHALIANKILIQTGN